MHEHGRRRIEARHGEARSRREEDEIPRLERERRLAIHGEPATAFQHHAIARESEVRVAHGPAARAADALREHGARLEQRDDFREGVARVKLVEPGYCPSTRFASNGGSRMERLIPEAYEPFARPIFEAFAQPGRSPPNATWPRRCGRPRTTRQAG